MRNSPKIVFMRDDGVEVIVGDRSSRVSGLMKFFWRNVMVDFSRGIVSEMRRWSESEMRKMSMSLSAANAFSEDEVCFGLSLRESFFAVSVSRLMMLVSRSETTRPKSQILMM